MKSKQVFGFLIIFRSTSIIIYIIGALPLALATMVVAMDSPYPFPKAVTNGIMDSATVSSCSPVNNISIYLFMPNKNSNGFPVHPEYNRKHWVRSRVD